MTHGEYPALDTAIDGLAAAYRKRLGPRELLAYRQALADVSLADAEAACQRILRSGAKWLPHAPEVRQVAEQVARDRHPAVSASTRASLAQGEYTCLRCLDTGFAYVADGQLVSMDVAVERGLRTVRHCPCRGTNNHYRAKEHASRVQRAHRADGER